MQDGVHEEDGGEDCPVGVLVSLGRLSGRHAVGCLPPAAGHPPHPLSSLPPGEARAGSATSVQLLLTDSCAAKAM